MTSAIPVPEQPDDAYFESWRTSEDFQAYFDSTEDHSAFFDWMLRTGRRGPAMGPKPTSLPVEPPKKLVSLRLPEKMIAELDTIAKSDHVREGRSGVVRAAVEQYLAERAD
jgi:hypothetical protein